MAESTPQTPQGNPDETGKPDANQTPATQPQKDAGAATGDEDKVTLSKKDYQNLVSQRDKGNERARATENWVMQAAMKEDINTFLNNPENKTKFPDVETSDLMDAEDEEDFEKLAAQTQNRIDKAANRRIGDIQKTETPTISPQEKAERLKKLKETPGSAAFQEMLDIKSLPVSQ